MKNIGALLAVLLLASVAVSAVAVEPLLAKTKPQKDLATIPFNFQSTSGTANLTSNRKTSYPATLTLSGVLTKTKQHDWSEDSEERERSTNEQHKTQQYKWLTKISITEGTLTINDGYYAAKVYKIIAGHGIYVEKNGRVQITCNAQEVSSGSIYKLILHGKKTSNGFTFQAPESRLARQYFLEITGQLQM